MKKIKEYILITIGLVFVAAGIEYFLVPNDLAAGGVSGLAIVINYYFPSISVGTFMLAANIILFIVAFILIGPSFGAKTIYASLGLSGIIWVMEKFFPIAKPLTNNLLLELIYGILISGVGMGIVFNQNASTGGTDIIAKILNKFFHFNIGKALLISDLVVTLGALITFGAEKGMYALLGVILNGAVIDEVIQGINTVKEVKIISSKNEEIKKFILDELGRGVTIYYARGGFTNEEKDMLVVLLSRREFIKLREFIKDIDERAFITVSNVHEVFGEGFKSFD
ncbi:YitT family protein [Caloramator sp. CAR-1]|uniref:YitT family protein n=1 Tax=Caloramator sp. CAR-1 TaxID=3062777 RepID=UPI0026E2D87B|nr:YitT family protein [Caloramator sp. CAR-1]MDO6353698.1 YitT family protein [Caloramator sp. CAR-1]